MSKSTLAENGNSLQRRLERLERRNAVLSAVVRNLLNDTEQLRSRLDETKMEVNAHGKQLGKVRASVKETPCDTLDEYDRNNGWTDLETRVEELELEVHAESLSRFDRLSKMSIRQLQEDDEVTPREAWAVLLLRNFDGWSSERVVGDIWFVSESMKRMFYQHLDLDADKPSQISTKKVHRACDKAMDLSDGEVMWVKLDGGRALVRPKDESRRGKLEELVKRTGN
ncbi:hypothetical protein EGH25_04660 [Haladaptatus sp. F3-133]|uniref:Uncharacterized protein n=1 Tax=Halorutilus salinus TaxID=2487751 RepID=A0A9Q4C3Y0_9EURY|nr:hypothetical protein [Halorutilus salinus]MCX2818642.1 hypothetical protein [Halorutilus salinus]